MVTADLEICIDRVVADSFHIIFGTEVVVASLVQEERALLESRIGGVVHIFGDWNGSIAFQCTGALLRELMAQIYGEQLEREAQDDLLRELANLLGGNLKTILGKRCILSPPKTLFEVRSATGVQEGELVGSREFRSHGQPFRVLVFENRIEIPIDLEREQTES